MIKLESRLQDPVLPQRLERELTFTRLCSLFWGWLDGVHWLFLKIFFNVHHSKVFIEFITILFLVMMAAKWQVFFSSWCPHQLTIGCGCSCWWLWHLLLTAMAGNIPFPKCLKLEKEDGILRMWCLATKSGYSPPSTNNLSPVIGLSILNLV